MAKNYAKMDTEELEKLAGEQERRQAALNQLARSDPSAMTAMTANERADYMKGREAERTNAWHKANMDAKARRLEGMVAVEGGRYNPQQQAAAVKWLNDNGYGAGAEVRRQFNVEQDTARKVSENEMLGKRDYGKGAAEVKSGADITMNRNEWETRMKIAEQEAAAKKYLGEQETAARKYGIDAEHGKIGEDGKVTPGSHERAMQIQGQDQIKIEQERGKTALAQTQIQSLNAQLDRESRERVAQITASGKYDSAKVVAHAKEIAALTKDILDPEEKAKIIAAYKENHKDDPAAIAATDALGGGGTEQFAR